MSAQSTAIHTFSAYSAAPDAESFTVAGLDDLHEILAELDRVNPTDCPGDLYDIVHHDLMLLRDVVIPAAERGVEILVAHDEDGYYFARRSEPSQEFAVIIPSSEDDPDCPDRGYSHHAHLTEDVYCTCGFVVALEIAPISERGATGANDQYPITRRDAGEWWIHCPGCGAEHVLVERNA